jgi:hypothetical protein
MKAKWIALSLAIASLLQMPFTAYATRYHSSNTSHRSGGSMPSQIPSLGEKVIIVNPRIHAFGAYDASGDLVRTGMVTAGNSWCRDIRRSCRTKVGSFRIFSLGSASCRSHRYPLPHGGAPMPYCMFFNGNQGLHGSYEVVYGNVSHGCVRMHVGDAKWLRFNFVEGPSSSNGYRGTRVIVRPY